MHDRRSRTALLAFVLFLAAALQGAAQTPSDPEPPWPDISPFNWVSPDDPDLALTLTASLVAVSGNQHVWKAQATDTRTGALVARLDVTITYGALATTYQVTYERFRNRWGFPPFSPTKNQDSFPTLYNDDGTIAYAKVGELTWFAAFVGANPLTPATMTAGIGAVAKLHSTKTELREMDMEPVPVVDGEWTPNGCNKPCSNHWKACCDVHDACYCKGGDATARKNCDEDFKQCLSNAGMSNWKAALYHKAVRLFGKSHFNCTDPMGC